MGDIGNPATFNHKVLYHKVNQAVVANIVSDQPLAHSLSGEFVEGAQTLEQKGATVIGTSCGFLASSQMEIQRSTTIPVVTSSLMLVPTLRTFFGNDTIIGVLTFDADKLDAIHFPNIGMNNTPSHIRIGGLFQNGELYQCIKNDKLELNTTRALEDVINATESIIKAHPEINVLLIECTNLSPYKEKIKETFGLPVFDLVDALKWIEQSSTP